MLRKTSISLRLVIAAILIVCLCRTSPSRAADFFGIGYLEPDDNFSSADWISRDGSAIVGRSLRSFSFEFHSGPRTYYTYQRAFIRDADGKRPLVTPASYFGGDLVTDVAPFGSAAFIWPVGNENQIDGLTVGTYSDPGMQIWTPEHSLVAVENGRFPKRFAGDKDTYAGILRSSVFDLLLSHAFRHTAQEGDRDLGWIAPTKGTVNPVREESSDATGISADGNVVVGTNRARTDRALFTLSNSTVYVEWPNTFYATEAFRWTPDVGMKPLGYLPNTDFSKANGVSGDGKVIFGQCAKDVTSIGFRWTEATEMTPIAALLEGQTAIINAANFDGSILVGSSEYFPWGMLQLVDGQLREALATAVIWDSAHGLRDLKVVLETEYGQNLTGWQLTTATDISDDGRTIIGNGINPQGNQEGWIAHLDPVAVPEPAAWTLFAVGACSAATISRRRRA